jgi:hypothetical protein
MDSRFSVLKSNLLFDGGRLIHNENRKLPAALAILSDKVFLSNIERFEALILLDQYNFLR